MKNLLKKWFCLALTLFLLTGSALAEPQRWLDPFIAAERRDASAWRSTLSVELDADTIISILSPLLDSVASPDRVMLGITEEEAEKFERQLRQSLENAKQQLTTNLSAFAALAKETALTVEADAQSNIRFSILLSGEPVLQFTQINQDGRVLLLSDLYPSYALDQTPDPSDDDAEEIIAWKILALLEALPDYADFDFLSQLTDLSRQELNALADAKLAVRGEDGISYQGTAEECKDCLERTNLVYDPLLVRLQNFIQDILDEMRDEMEWETEDSEEEEDEPEAPVSMRYEISGSEVIREYTSPREYTVYDETKDPDTGAVTRTSRPDTWEKRQLLHLTPTSLSLEEVFDPQAFVSLNIHADKADEITAEIVFSVTDPDGVYEPRMDFQWIRTEEGQEMNLVLRGIGRAYLPTAGLSRQSAEAPEDAAELIPPLKMSCAYPNDLRRMDMAFSVQSGEAWKTAFAAHVTVEDQVDFPEFPGAEGRTVLFPNRFGSYTDAGYQNELRTVAVPYLNRLVLTKLPRDARPLMTTLLVLVSQLGQ